VQASKKKDGKNKREQSKVKDLRCLSSLSAGHRQGKPSIVKTCSRFSPELKLLSTTCVQSKTFCCLLLLHNVVEGEWGVISLNFFLRLSYIPVPFYIQLLSPHTQLWMTKKEKN